MKAPSSWYCYNLFNYALGIKTVNLGSSDTFKMALFTSSSNAGNSALYHSSPGTPPVYNDLTNEVSNGNGYTTGGYTCAATWSDSSGVETFGLANGIWTASGSGIVAEFAVIYDSTTGNLIEWCYLDSTPESVTIASGGGLTVISPSGAFLLNPTLAVTCAAITTAHGVSMSTVTAMAAGGSGTYTFAAYALPSALSISSGGAITGVPASAGSYSAVVVVTDSLGNTAWTPVTVTIT